MEASRNGQCGSAVALVCSGKRDARDQTGESWAFKRFGGGAIGDAPSINRLWVSIARVTPGTAGVTSSEARLATDKNGVT
jgi:hypothetical protein